MSNDQEAVNRSRAAWRKLYEDERFAHFKTRAESKETVTYYAERELADLRERNALMAEIDRLRAENAELRELCGAAFHKLGYVTNV